jgi:hypothetical protein
MPISPNSQDQNHMFPEQSGPNPNLPEQQTSQPGGYQPMINVQPDIQENPEAVVYNNPMTNAQNPGYYDPNNQYSNYSYQQNQAVYQNPSNSYFQIGPEPEVQKTQNKDTKATSKFNLKKIGDWLLAKWWLVLLVVIALAVCVVGAYSFLNKPKGYTPTDFTQVNGRIQAPTSSPSGSPSRWNVVIQNKESVSIQNLKVKLNFDRTFKYTKPINPDPSTPQGDTYDFSSLAAQGQGTSEIIIQFEGVLSGNIDEEAVMSGEITYTPTPLLNTPNNTRSVSISAAKTRITAPEIRIDMTPSEQSVQNGSEVELNINFENLSERELKDLRVRMSYPDRGGFTYLSSQLSLSGSDPKTRPDDGNNVWFINTLPRLQQQNLKVRGNVLGAEGVKQNFSVEIAIKTNNNDYQTLATTSRDVLVTAQPLVISTTINGKDASKSFDPGETLRVDVNYQNKGTTTLKNVEVFAFIDDPADVLDYSTITFDGGYSGNINNRVLQWRGSSNPQLVNLSPQVSGKFTYSVRVKSGESFLKSSLNQTSYTLRPRAQSKAGNVQQVEFAGELYKAKGDLQFEQKITPGKIDPNQANKQTFTITWTLKTRQNKVNDPVVETISNLPPTSWQQSSISPAANADKLSYDPLTGKITWKPGNLESYTGLSSPLVSISFDLIVVAPEGSSTSNVELFKAAKITGVDDFTGERYDRTGPPAKT